MTKSMVDADWMLRSRPDAGLAAARETGDRSFASSKVSPRVSGGNARMPAHRPSMACITGAGTLSFCRTQRPIWSFAVLDPFFRLRHRAIPDIPRRATANRSHPLRARCRQRAPFQDRDGQRAWAITWDRAATWAECFHNCSALARRAGVWVILLSELAHDDGRGQLDSKITQPALRAKAEQLWKHSARVAALSPGDRQARCPSRS